MKVFALPETMGGGKGGGEGSLSSVSGMGGGGGVLLFSDRKLYRSISFCKSDICLSISSKIEDPDFSGVSPLWTLPFTELDRIAPDLLG